MGLSVAGTLSQIYAQQNARPESGLMSEVEDANRSLLMTEKRRSALARRRKLGLLSLLSGSETGLPEQLGG